MNGLVSNLALWPTLLVIACAVVVLVSPRLDALYLKVKRSRQRSTVLRFPRKGVR